jgi:hypothetical protein
VAYENEEKLSTQLLMQRVRNRIIEYLELASSFESQLEYQEKAPIHVPNEVINQWEDWVQPKLNIEFIEPVFSRSEQNAIAAFNHVWELVASETPDPLPNLKILFMSTEWQLLRSAAADALAVFAVRGRLSEEIENDL